MTNMDGRFHRALDIGDNTLATCYCLCDIFADDHDGSVHKCRRWVLPDQFFILFVWILLRLWLNCKVLA